MAVIFLILPLAIALAGVAVFVFLRSARAGQFDDLDTPPWRMLFDDEGERRERAADTHPAGKTSAAASGDR